MQSYKIKVVFLQRNRCEVRLHLSNWNTFHGVRLALTLSPRKAQRELERVEIMCTCIAEIKESYTKVRHQTAEVAQQKFDIDDYLDMVIVVRKKLEEITVETNNLVETVRDHFTEFDEQETTELLAHSAPILILMDQLHQKLVESPLYPGLKTAAENYHDCVSDFQELCTDLQTFNIDVPRNEKCREVEELLRKLA